MRCRPDLAPCLRAAVLLGGLALWAASASAQFAMVPAPMPATGIPSQADSENDYRRDAAKHVYASFPMRIYRGKMPPLLYGVAIVDVDVDADGKITDTRMRRPPAAPEVGPWIMSMIRKVGPFPPPSKLGEKVTFSEIWLVDKSGNFQLDSLTEGQR